MFAVNATGTGNVLAAMAACGASRLVFLSSIAVYAARPDRIPVAETFALGSDTAYGQSKIAAERLVLDAAGAGWRLRQLSCGFPPFTDRIGEPHTSSESFRATRRRECR